MTNPHSTTRREILQCGAGAALVAATSPLAATTRTSRGDDLRIAVVGAGGRGSGAVVDNLRANKGTRLVAMADVKPEIAAQKLAKIKEQAELADRIDATQKDVYGGLDGIDKVLARADVDIVLLATPPGFRPGHIAKAVAARKHVFAEKPVCVDPAGYRVCLAAHDKAVKQGTAIVTGTQYRRQESFREAIDRLHKGVIGRIVSATGRYCSQGIWYRKREAGMSDVQYQIHNWMHFVWLSGDQICEQAVHNIDALHWIMGAPPTEAFGSGGRFFRPADSEMWDSMSVDYQFDGGRLASLTCRQLAHTDTDADNVVYCEGGVAQIRAFNGGSVILDSKGKTVWKMRRGNIGAAYRQEHKDLVDSIVAGKPIVELRQTADSSLMAVMGRMSAYTGKRVRWDFVTGASKLALMPDPLAWDGALVSKGFALPGKTPLE